MDVTNLQSARVFVSLGSPLTDLSAAKGYAPDVNAPTIGGVANPNFLTRLDKYEITYTPASGTPGTPQYVPAAGGANLSASDFFGIPLQLQTKGGAQPTTLTWNYNDAVNTAAVFHALGALENFQTDTSSNTLGAIVAGGANGVTINTPNGPLNGVVRIIAPSSTNGGTTPYANVTNYISHIESAKSTPTIAGQNGQITKGGPFQNYSFNASIPSTGANAGGLVMTGTVQSGSGPTTTITITVSPTVMTSYAIYGANPPTPAPAHRRHHRLGRGHEGCRRLFRWTEFRLHREHREKPEHSGEYNWKVALVYMVRQSAGPKPAKPSAPHKAASAERRLRRRAAAFFTGEPGYNMYAAYLNGGSTPVTDAYGFPYTDRISSPLAPLDDNTVLTMTILPDDGETPPSGWVITVPAPTTQTFADLLVGPTPSSMLTVTGGGPRISGRERLFGRHDDHRRHDGRGHELDSGNLALDRNRVPHARQRDPRGRREQSCFQQRRDADKQRRDLRHERQYAHLEWRHFGRGQLTKVGAGTLILGSTNTYAGGTLVDGGTLGLGANNALGTGPVAMQPGTTLQFEASGIALENSIVLNANPTFDTGSNADAISGAISGPGALTKIGSGTLILAGSNTYAGGTFSARARSGFIEQRARHRRSRHGARHDAPVRCGRLTLANAIVLNADPTIDTQANTAIISGVISGSGSLDKIGSGTLILTAANTYTGPTDVQEGTLGLRGSLASTVTVESGATLGGTGSVGGLVANGGATVAPGVLGPYAKFTVTGEASFAAGSTFAVNVGAPGQNDKLVSTGSTTLSGGTVAVSGAGGTYLPSTRYTILTAEGGLSGTFSSLSSGGNLASLAFLAPTLSYDADDVYLGFSVLPFANGGADA